MTNLNNPQKIDRIELTKTKDGTPIVAFYVEPLEFAALTLFQSQFGELFAVGIDPNTLQPGQPVYTRFLAHWETINKSKKTGAAYQNVTRLEQPPDPAAVAQNAVMVDILGELRAIRALLMLSPAVTDQAEKEPGNSRRDEAPAPTVTDQAEKQAAESQPPALAVGTVVKVQGNKEVKEAKVQAVIGDLISVLVGNRSLTVSRDRILFN